MDFKLNQIKFGHCIDIINSMPEKSVNCIITSPPYYNARYYKTEPQIWSAIKCEHEWESGITKGISGGKNSHLLKIKGTENFQEVPDAEYKVCKKCNAYFGELGREPTPNMYINNLWSVFDACKRILTDDGSLWINIGCSYQKDKDLITENGIIRRTSHIGIPERLLIAMIDSGWICRGKLIWHKSDAMPSCLDPSTKIFVKNHNDLTQQISLDDLYNLDWKNISILTPSGWKKIINIWKTKKLAMTFNAGYIDSIACSVDHRFGISKDWHKDRSLAIRYENPREFEDHKLIYCDLKAIISSEKNKILDILSISNKLDWFCDLRYLSREEFIKLIGKNPLDIAKRCSDQTLRKVSNGKSWTYTSNTHSEYKKQIMRVSRVKILAPEFHIDKIKVSKSPKIDNRFIPLNSEIGWMLGLYTAEGGFNQPRGYQGKITLHEKEFDSATKFSSILKKYFNTETKISHSKTTKAIEVKFASASLYTFCTFLVPNSCTTKELNIDYILNTPIEFRQSLWEGYIEGDGHISKSGRVSVASASEKLISHFLTLSASIGIIFSRNEYIKRENRKIYQAWNSGDHVFNYGQYALVKPKDIRDLGIYKEFIDIEVEDHVFLIENGLLSHNSIDSRFTIDYEMLYWFTKSNNPLYWVNPRTHQIAYQKPNKDAWINDRDWIDIPCAKCDGSGKIDGKICNNCEGKGIKQKILWSSMDYYFNQIKEKAKHPNRIDLGGFGGKNKHEGYGNATYSGRPYYADGTKNKRTFISIPNEDHYVIISKDFAEEIFDIIGMMKGSVLEMATSNLKEDHFAVFPKALVRIPIRATCPKEICTKCGLPRVKLHDIVSCENRKTHERKIEKKDVGYSICACPEKKYKRGVVFDPFMGSGTTALVALEENVKYYGSELQPSYKPIQEKRLKVAKRKNLTDFGLHIT